MEREASTRLLLRVHRESSGLLDKGWAKKLTALLNAYAARDEAALLAIITRLRGIAIAMVPKDAMSINLASPTPVGGESNVADEAHVVYAELLRLLGAARPTPSEAAAFEAAVLQATSSPTPKVEHDVLEEARATRLDILPAKQSSPPLNFRTSPASIVSPPSQCQLSQGCALLPTEFEVAPPASAPTLGEDSIDSAVLPPPRPPPQNMESHGGAPLCSVSRPHSP